jgi:hypothetical protein
MRASLQLLPSARPPCILACWYKLVVSFGLCAHFHKKDKEIEEKEEA